MPRERPSLQTLFSLHVQELFLLSYSGQRTMWETARSKKAGGPASSPSEPMRSPGAAVCVCDSRTSLSSRSLATDQSRPSLLQVFTWSCGRNPTDGVCPSHHPRDKALLHPGYELQGPSLSCSEPAQEALKKTPTKDNLGASSTDLPLRACLGCVGEGR